MKKLATTLFLSFSLLCSGISHADIGEEVQNAKAALNNVYEICKDAGHIKQDLKNTIETAKNLEDVIKNIFKGEETVKDTRPDGYYSALPPGWDNPFHSVSGMNLPGICENIQDTLLKAQGNSIAEGKGIWINQFMKPAEADGLSQFQQLLFGFARLMAYLLIPIALGYGFIHVTQIIFDSSNAAENASKAKEGLINIAVGLIMFSAAPEFTKVFDIAVKGKNSIGSAAQAQSAFGMISEYLAYFAGAVAVFFIFTTAARLMTSGGSDDNTDILKKRLLYSTLGLILILTTNKLVNEIFYPSTTTPMGEAQIRLLAAEAMGILEYLFGYGAMIILGMMIFTGFSIIMSQDEDASSRAKTLLKNLAIGFVSLFLAYTAVSFIVPLVENTGTVIQ